MHEWHKTPRTAAVPFLLSWLAHREECRMAERGLFLRTLEPGLRRHFKADRERRSRTGLGRKGMSEISPGGAAAAWIR